MSSIAPPVAWQEELIGHVLRICITRAVPGLYKLSTNPSDPRVATHKATVDEILVERLSSLEGASSEGSTLNFLLAAFARAVHCIHSRPAGIAYKLTKDKVDDSDFRNGITTILSVVGQYCALVMIEPELYEESVLDVASKLPPHGHVARLLATRGALPGDFINVLVNSLADETPSFDSEGGADDLGADEDSVDLRTVMLPIIRRLCAWIGMHQRMYKVDALSPQATEILRMMNVIDVEEAGADDAAGHSAGTSPAHDAFGRPHCWERSETLCGMIKSTGEGAGPGPKFGGPAGTEPLEPEAPEVQPVRIADAESFSGPLRALSMLMQHRHLIGMVARSTMWRPYAQAGAHPPSSPRSGGSQPASGARIERESFLGVILGLGPARRDSRRLAAGKVLEMQAQARRRQAGALQALVAQFKAGAGNPSGAERAHQQLQTVAADLGQDSRVLGMRILDHIRTGAPLEDVLEGDARGGAAGGGGGGGGGATIDDTSAALGRGDLATAVALEPQSRRSGMTGYSAPVRSALEGFYSEVRSGIRAHVAMAGGILKTMMKRGAREQAFAWMGDVLQANSRRGGMQYTHFGRQPREAPFSSPALLHNLASVLIDMCEPFLDPVSPMSAAIDLRFMSRATPGGKGSGAGRFDCSEEAVLSRIMADRAVDGGKEGSEPAGSEAPAAGGPGRSTLADRREDDHAVDRRNLSRQQAWATRLRAVASEMAGEAAGSDASSELGAVPVFAPSKYTGATTFFFLALRALHVGPVSSIARLNRIDKQLQQVKKQRDTLRDTLRMFPAQHLQEQLRHVNEALTRLCEEKLELEASLLDPAEVDKRMRFYRLVSVLLLRGALDPVSLNGKPAPADAPASGVGAPASGKSAKGDTKKPKSLPLPIAKLPLPLPSPVLAGLPEHVVQDVAGFLVWSVRALSSRELAAQPIPLLSEFVGFCVAFVASPLHATATHVRHRLVEALETFAPGHYDIEARRRLAAGEASAPERFALLVRHPLALKSLAPALIRFYQDAETSGSHTQFYDRFTMRMSVANILGFALQYHPHRAALKEFATNATAVSSSTLKRFASHILNDVNHHFNEIEENLRTATELIVSKAAGQWPQHEAADRSKRLKEALGVAKHWAFELEHQMFLLADVCECAPLVFGAGDMAPRLAQTLLQLLRMLHGPDKEICDAAEPGNKPVLSPTFISYLSARALVAVHQATAAIDPFDAPVSGPASGAGAAGGEPVSGTDPDADGGDEDHAPAVVASASFVGAMAREDRYFDEGVLRRCAEILGAPGAAGACHGYSPDSASKQLGLLVARVHSVREQVEDEEGEDEDEEVPEEFECEMLSTLMRDPVRLPGGVVVDRPNIERHLLDSDMNPYTREPMTLADVEPLPELKARIEAYRRERREARRAAKAAGGPSSGAEEGGGREPAGGGTEGASVERGASGAAASAGVEASQAARADVAAEAETGAPPAAAVGQQEELDEEDDELMQAIRNSLEND